MPHTLADSLREISQELKGNSAWADVCRRAAIQLDIMYTLSGLTADELPDLTGVITLEGARERGERAMLISTIYRSSGNKTLAAKWLGISRPNLYKSLRKHGLITGDDNHDDESEL